MFTYLDVARAKVLGGSAVTEASLGRIFQHVQDAGVASWGVVTSWRYGADPGKAAENSRNLKELRSYLSSLGLGYFLLHGHYEECSDGSHAPGQCPKGHERPVAEPSFFVPGLTHDQALSLARKYNQDSVLYAGPETRGDVVFLAKDGTTTNAGKYHPGRIGAFMSKVKGRPFVFEWAPQTFVDHLLERAIARLTRTKHG